jgi:hypothetical protein
MFSDVGDSDKKYKTAIFKPKQSKFCTFLPSSSITNLYRSDLWKNPGAEYLKLGPLLGKMITLQIGGFHEESEEDPSINTAQ